MKVLTIFIGLRGAHILNLSLEWVQLNTPSREGQRELSLSSLVAVLLTAYKVVPTLALLYPELGLRQLDGFQSSHQLKAHLIVL